MNQQAKKQPPVNKEEHPYTFSDEATKEKIKRHLTDIKDVITENDIANVKIPGKDDVGPSVEREKNPEVEDLESTRNKPVTPWDTLED
jgi:hypothetical protein